MKLVVLAVAVLAAATPALAQSTSDPLPRVAFDIHGVTVGLPTAEGWVPPVSADTPLPGRAWVTLCPRMVCTRKSVAETSQNVAPR
mgnify:CR=1 FL=1